MAKKPERNAPCHCGSGRKYKNCCQDNDQAHRSSKLGIIGLVIAVVLAVVVAGMILMDRDSPPDCPPGTVWSDAHQHCH